MHMGKCRQNEIQRFDVDDGRKNVNPHIKDVKFGLSHATPDALQNVYVNEILKH